MLCYERYHSKNHGQVYTFWSYFYFRGHFSFLFKWLPDICGMEHVNANVKRSDTILFTVRALLLKKDKIVAAVFSICTEYHRKSRNRHLGFINVR